MSAATPSTFDCAIIGAGPAGCSAASWLAQLGHTVALIERGSRACQSLQGFDFAQSWVLGAPDETLAAQGSRYAAQVEAMPGVQIFTQREPRHIGRQDQLWRIDEDIAAKTLLIASGLRPRQPAQLFPASDRVLDALTLTQRREQLSTGSRVLLLGGGDNAVENALFLAERGHHVTIWSRSRWRAQAQFVQQMEADARITQRAAQTMPSRVDADATVHSQAHGSEAFDFVAVLLGYEPNPEAWALATASLPPLQAFGDEPRHALFVAGDASQRMHPCVQTALADGVVAAKRIEAHLADRPTAAALQQHHRQQVIHIAGLRFDANLGILDFEREDPQPIQVDAEINLGPQALVSSDADIGHVLDYRRIRQIIIDECTAEHTDILEALVAKLCTRLMKLPGVVGVRAKVNKLEIFPDCQVAISAETGVW